MKPDLWTYGSMQELSRAAAAFVAPIVQMAVKKRGRASIVLAGGNTPRPVYELLSQPPYHEGLPWRSVHLFFGDERCVPPDAPESNYRMVHETLVERIAIPEGNVHVVPTVGVDPEEGARQYEAMIRAFCGAADSPPAFDLVLLGMGTDGHTCSLFPNDSALDERGRWVIAVDGEQGVPPLPRVTMTLPLINAAANVAFLVGGEEKGALAKRIAKGKDDAVRALPAARVEPAGRLVWFVEG